MVLQGFIYLSKLKEPYNTFSRYFIFNIFLNTVALEKNDCRQVNPLSTIYEKNIFPNLLLFLCPNLLSSVLFIFLLIIHSTILLRRNKDIAKCFSIMSKLSYHCI